MVIKEYIEKDLKFISVSNHDHFEVIFCELGAAIFAIKMDGKYFTQTPRDVDTYKQVSVYHGKTIGRVGNRIENASMKIGGKEYHFDPNEVKHTLHGGKEGLSAQKFSYKIKEDKEGVVIEFHYLSKDMEGGFPGNFDTTVTYTLYEDKNEILLDFKASCDKLCPVGLTNHAYFTLGSKNLKKLSLMINADKFIHPRPTDLIPLEVREVDEIMDFRNIHPIMKYMKNIYLKDSRTNGYDHHFVYQEVNPNIPQVILKNKKYEMDIYTDFSGLQIYTDNFGDSNRKWHSLRGKENRSIAIEPQDSTLKRYEINKGDVYSRFIKYKFIRNK